MYPQPIRLLIGAFPLAQAIDGLGSGAFPMLQIAYVWAIAALSIVIAVKIFEKNMHL